MCSAHCSDMIIVGVGGGGYEVGEEEMGRTEVLLRAKCRSRGVYFLSHSPCQM